MQFNKLVGIRKSCQKIFSLYVDLFNLPPDQLREALESISFFISGTIHYYTPEEKKEVIRKRDTKRVSDRIRGEKIINFKTYLDKKIFGDDERR